MKRSILIAISILGLSMGGSSAFAYDLTVPSNLVSLDSDYGQEIFSQSYYKQAYWGLSENYVTQSSGTDCGIASAVMVINALKLTPPRDPRHPGFYEWTQNNILNIAQQVFSLRQLNHEGLSLPNEADLLQRAGLSAHYYYGRNISLSTFRSLATAAVSQPNQEAIVDFNRQALNQQGEGHFSPLAAYDSNTDRFLVMDVARYKYPPVWVKTADLYRAISHQGHGLSWRGLVTVQKNANIDQTVLDDD